MSPSFRFLIAFAIACSPVSQATRDIKGWCAQRGWPALGLASPAIPLDVYQWKAFRSNYIHHLAREASPYFYLSPRERTNKIEEVEQFLAEQERLWKGRRDRARTVAERFNIDRDFFSAFQDSVEPRALASYLLVQHLSQLPDASPLIELNQLKNIRNDPRKVLNLSHSLIVDQIQRLIPTEKTIFASPDILHPETWRMERVSERNRRNYSKFSPSQRIAKIQEIFWSSSNPDSQIDDLIGLDAFALKTEDALWEHHTKGEMAWINSTHGFYSSSYRSFPVYVDALDVPSHGTVAELGAGPFRAVIPLGVVRNDLKIVGYELVPSRVAAGQRIIDHFEIGDRAQIIEKNLSDPELNLVLADGYILMNPFPQRTSENIFQNLRRVAQRSEKKFRVLIYEHADDTLRVARQQTWLRMLGSWPKTSENKYGFSVFEVRPSGTLTTYPSQFQTPRV